ncbi:MAG: hypothetical protein WCG98_05250 [bacterium]
MQDIRQREEKIQAKRMQTPWRDFLKEIASWFNVSFNKNTGIISIFPETERCGIVYEASEYKQKFIDGFP